MVKFEEIFGVPAEHRLKTEFHSHGGGQYESWTHEEFDSNGHLIARYESWAHTTYLGKPTTEGWRKFDLAGRLLDQGETLPI